MWLAWKFIGNFNPTKSFLDFVNFDGKKNFVTFTRMKRTANISKTTFYCSRCASAEKRYGNLSIRYRKIYYEKFKTYAIIVHTGGNFTGVVVAFVMNFLH